MLPKERRLTQWKFRNFLIRPKMYNSKTYKYCVCVFILFHLGGFFQLQWCLWHTWDVRINDLVLWVYARCFCQVPSSLFPNLSYFTSKDETLARWQTGEKTICYIGNLRKDDIYWYRISQLRAKADKWRKDTKDKEATLI